MKIGLMLVAAVVSVSSFGQGLVPRRPLGGRLARPSAPPNKERLNAMYPSGTNKFGRTFEQQVDFEKNFDVKTFLGFEFGKQYSGAGIVTLNRPYRLFDKVELQKTVLGRLSGLRLEKEVADVTKESLSNELRKVVAHLESVYQIPLMEGRWYDRNLGNYSFNSPIVAFGVYGTYSDLNGTGSICLWLSKHCLYTEDQKAREVELQKVMSEKGKSINIPDGEGADLLTAVEPKVTPPSTNDTGTIRSPGSLEGDSLEAERQELARREYWQGWPRSAPSEGSNYLAIAKGVEKKFKVALVDICHDSKWRVGDGRSCIKLSASDGYYYEKFDAKGRLVLVSGCRTDFEELKAIDEARAAWLKAEREEWAKSKGLTYEEAMARSNEWQNVSMLRRVQLVPRRPGSLGGGLLGGGSLRARRLQRQQEAAADAAKQREEQAAKDAERQAQAEQEKQQREAERAEQRQQLLAIQEELKRTREAKAAAESNANEE